MKRLIQDGDSVYMIDEACMRKKRERQERLRKKQQMEKTQAVTEQEKNGAVLRGAKKKV